MPWIMLTLAGLFEIGWAVAIKYTEGMTKVIPTSIMMISMAFSIYFLSVALRSLPLGTAYAVWTGIGVFGTVLFGIFIFGESVNPLRLFFLLMIFVAIIGLKLTTKISE